MRKTKTEDQEAGRERSGYPYMGLKPALKVSDAMKELGGARAEVQKNVLAHQLGEKEKSPSFSQRISSAKCFGLVEGRGSYKLTDLGRRYYFPTSDGEKRHAMLGIVSAPECFGQLIKRFDGDKVPDREILGNLLHREFMVPGSWQERVAAFFLGALEVAGVLDTQGILRFGATQNGTQTNPSLTLIDGPAHSPSVKSELTPPASTSANGSSVPIQPASGVNVHNIRYKDAIMRIETPQEFEMPHWEKLNAYVQYLKSTAKEGQ